jgi:hypothetical protein
MINPDGNINDDATILSPRAKITDRKTQMNTRTPE